MYFLCSLYFILVSGLQKYLGRFSFHCILKYASRLIVNTVLPTHIQTCWKIDTGSRKKFKYSLLFVPSRARIVQPKWDPPKRILSLRSFKSHTLSKTTGPMPCKPVGRSGDTHSSQSWLLQFSYTFQLGFSSSYTFLALNALHFYFLPLSKGNLLILLNYLLTER